MERKPRLQRAQERAPSGAVVWVLLPKAGHVPQTPPSQQKEHCQYQVNGGEPQVIVVQPGLAVQNHRGQCKAQLLKHGERNDWAQPHRLPGNRKEEQLPCQRYTDKPLEEHRIRDRWGILLIDGPLHEVQRRN